MSPLFKYTLPALLLLVINPSAHADVAIDNTPWPSATSPTPRDFNVSSIQKRPIFIFAFIHDDISESMMSSLFPDHLIPAIKELELTTGRKVSVQLIRNMPPYTSYAYKRLGQASYDGWSALAGNYRDSQNLPRNRTVKFILLTNDFISGRIAGMGGVGQPFAIASLTSQQVFGHELGHTLDAQHELAEVRFNGWACETFMVAESNSLRSNCYVFTDPNRARINAFLEGTP